MNQNDLDKFRQLAETMNAANGRPCPSCGRCPTCGRGAFWGTQPYPGYIPPPLWYSGPNYGVAYGVSGTAINYPSTN